MNRIDWGVRGVQLGALTSILLLWYYVGYANLVSPIFLPRLEEVFEKLIGIIATGAVYEPLRVTVGEVLSAYVLSAFLGLTAGYLIGRSRYATAALEPLLASIFAIPIIIFLPLFILMLGIGPESKTAFGASYAFFPIALNTIAGVSQVDARYITVAKTLGATDLQMFRRVIVPAALPVILVGIRIGFIIGFLAIIGSEMIAGLGGLGNHIVRLAEGMNTAEMFAYILFVIMLATILNATLSHLQNRYSQAGTVST